MTVQNIVFNKLKIKKIFIFTDAPFFCIPFKAYFIIFFFFAILVEY